MAAVARAIGYLPLAPLTVLLTWAYWVATRQTSSLADINGRDSLNFQISMLLYGAALFVIVAVITLASHVPMPSVIASHGGGWLSLFGIFNAVVLFSVLIAMGVFYSVTIAVAIIATLLGRPFASPLTIRFFR